MVHECNIHCRTVDLDKAEALGMSDQGHWLSFAFLIETIVACKMASDDPDNITFECTTIFTDQGDAYIIDTPYSIFKPLWVRFILDQDDVESNPNNLTF